MRLASMLSILVILGVVPTLESGTVPTSTVTLPDSPPAKRLVELLRIVNGGDRAALVMYARTGFAPSMMKPDDSILDFLHGHYRSSGGFEVRRVLQSSDRQITALVQGKTKPDVWLRYVVGTETTPPYLVSAVFTFQGSAAMAEETTDPIAEPDLPARFTELVDRIAADDGFSGTVCLARGGKVLVHKAWGEADREAHLANTPETRFGVASVSKLFTAVGIAKLVEAGKLALDDSVAKYAPAWLPPGADAITVEQLLTHTSGFGDYLEAVIRDRSGKTYDRLEDYRRFALETRFTSPPGSFRYSNVGYVLLGVIIEKVTGEPWDAWILSNVLAPIGVSSTSVMRPARHDSGIAVGYYREDDGRWERTDSLMAGRGTPAGGGVSTSEDLVKFATAFAAGRLVSKAMLERMTAPRASMVGTGKQYGYGVEVAQGRDGRRVYGHEGGFPGVGALVEVYEPSGYTLAVLSNTTGGATPIADAWRDLLTRVQTKSAKP